MLEDYITVDLEMTGLNPKTDRILEVGAVKVVNKQIRETFSRLVRPGRKLDPKVTALTGITDAAAAKGEAQDDVLNAFLEFAGDLIWVGHNVIFDYQFVRQWEVNHRIKRVCYAVDTLKIARRCLSGLEQRTLDSLCNYFQIPREVSHRALADAQATQSLYEILEAQFLEQEPGLFAAKELTYRVKRQTPATPRQKEYLTYLMEYHRLRAGADIPDIPFEQMSRSDVSRLTDQILHRYGKPGVTVR